jgi:hypothetical protein
MISDKKSDPFAGVPRRLYRVREAAHYLGMSKSKVRQLAWSGKLPFVKMEKILSCCLTCATWTAEPIPIWRPGNEA